MSEVLNFFKEHPQSLDETHRVLGKLGGLEAALLPIRQQMLACCGASQGKNGEIKLVVADLPRWEELSKQQATITAKLDAIQAFIEALDSIIEEARAAGFEVGDKTVRGISGVEQSSRKYGSQKTDDFGHPIKGISDPRALAWAQRAERALAEAGSLSR